MIEADVHATAGPRFGRFTDDELGQLIDGLFYGAGEGAFDPEGNLARELDAEADRRDLTFLAAYRDEPGKRRLRDAA